MPGVATRKSQKKDWPGLAATLARFDDDRLAGLLALRADLARPAPRDLPALAARAEAWPSARDCYHELDVAARHVVDALCLLPQPTTLGDLATLLGVPDDDADLATALLRTEERALAFRSDDGEVRLLPVLAQLDYPGHLGPPLASVLASQTVTTLAQVAVRLGERPAGTKPATLALIAGVLADPAAVGRLAQQGPAGTAELARRIAVGGPLVGVRDGTYRADDRTPAGWMLNRGLLGPVDFYTGVMPREVAVALRGGRAFPERGLRRPEPDVALVDGGLVDRTAAERALRVVADVAAILDQWGTAPPAVLKTGGIGIRELRKAAKATDRTETEAARIVELAAAAGLVGADIVTGMVLPTPRYDDWLALEAPARWARLATAWVDVELHVSLAGAIGTNQKPIPPLLHRAPEHNAARRRRLVLTVLDDAAPGTAPQAPSVRDRVEWESPATWAGGPAQVPLLVSWVLEEADLTGLAAHGSLSRAGRAVLAGREPEAAAALAALAPPAVSEFVVQTDLTAVIAGEPAAAVRAELDLLADVESKGAATVYRFTEGSLRRGFDAGRTTADILAFLERHATRGVPQPLAYLVGDLGRRFGNVRVGAATTYLRGDDPSLLAEVLQARRTARLRLRQIAPTVLVTAVDAATVAATLQAAGYLPAREAADGALLVARPVGRRLADRPQLPRPAPATPDLVAIVCDLRRKPLPTAPPVAKHTPVQPPPPSPWPPPTLLDVVRPTEIVKDTRAVRDLLLEACEEYWVVRLSYVDGKGLATELTVEPTDLDGRNLYASCFPRGNRRTFAVGRIEWARILTEAEEELLP